MRKEIDSRYLIVLGEYGIVEAAVRANILATVSGVFNEPVTVTNGVGVW